MVPPVRDHPADQGALGLMLHEAGGLAGTAKGWRDERLRRATTS